MITVPQKTIKQLYGIGKDSFPNLNFVLDYLFYVFDTLTISEKERNLKLFNEKKTKIKFSGDKSAEKRNDKVMDQLENINEFELHPLIEKRLKKLSEEAKFESITETLNFLLFVFKNIPKELSNSLKEEYWEINSLTCPDEPCLISKGHDPKFYDPEPLHINPDNSLPHSQI
ncbi:MAG: hypothetical protein ACXAC7_07765 [Candidatus Hodarchaeales archaeon]|jgi:lipoate-protein ligase A